MALLAQHKATVAEWNTAWDRLGELKDDAEIPIAMVQIGVRGRNEPLYAYSEADIDREIDLWARIDHRPERIAKWEERRALFKAELARQKQIVRDMEDACGVTAAKVECERVDKVMRDLADKLFAAKPATAAEACAVAAYVIAALDGEISAFDDTDALAFVRGLATAGRA
ncbi:MAG TPA: hypothetical protein VGN97_16990 [Mesorhizobium sp.]|nr:hypothetical protein [Mesorhizobium sp.]